MSYPIQIAKVISISNITGDNLRKFNMHIPASAIIITI